MQPFDARDVEVPLSDLSASSLVERLCAPRDNITLVLTRIAFGVFVAIRMGWYFAVDFYDFLALSPFTAPYWGFYWLPNVGVWVDAVLAVGFAAGLGLALGIFARWAAILVVLTLGYVFFIDVATWGNLDYFFIWLAILFAISPHDGRLSYDVRRGARPRITETQTWAHLAPRILVFVLYFFAGLIKLNGDWLSGDVFAVFVAQDLPASVASIFTTTPLGVAMAISGAAFDLFIVPLFMVRTTRKLAVAALVVFHTTNFFLLDIYFVAPMMLLITLVLFLPDSFWSARIAPYEQDDPEPWPLIRESLWVCRMRVAALGVFAAFHLLVPLRFVAMHDSIVDALWSQQAMHYSWWLRSYSIQADAKFYVTTDREPERQRIKPLDYVSKTQSMFLLQPGAIVTFADVVRRDMEAKGHRDVAVWADIDMSLNGRPHRPFTDPEIDWTMMERRFDMRDTIVPLNH